MAERPVFVPAFTGSRLVDEVAVSFRWNPGMAPVQKRKNVAALHESAALVGLHPLLEISSKSEEELGRRLSAFSLKMTLNGRDTTLESVFQGSKIFELGGPFTDLYWANSRDAKRDARIKSSGRLTGFRFMGADFPLSPSTVFYDWLYLNALYPHRLWLSRLQKWIGFTDIEFNPERSVNCQARSCAVFVALQKRDLLDRSASSFEYFRSLMQASGI